MGTVSGKQYQEEYKELLLAKIGLGAAYPALYQRVANMRPEIKQFVVKELGVVDRCTTCHMGIEDALFSDANQPLTAHPNLELLKKHPVEKFGCTICHGGQGSATSFDGAAHQAIPHWPDPMVGKAFMQSRCGYCHGNYQAIQADKLVSGRRLFKDLYCSGCHKVSSATLHGPCPGGLCG